MHVKEAGKGAFWEGGNLDGFRFLFQRRVSELFDVDDWVAVVKNLCIIRLEARLSSVRLRGYGPIP